MGLGKGFLAAKTPPTEAFPIVLIKRENSTYFKKNNAMKR